MARNRWPTSIGIGGPLQLGTVASLRSDWVAHFVGIRNWVLKRLAEKGLVRGETVSVDATTLEANAAMRSIVRRDSGQGYEEYLKALAKAAGIEERRGNNSRGWTGSGRRRARTKIGRVRTIRTHASRR